VLNEIECQYMIKNRGRASEVTNSRESLVSDVVLEGDMIGCSAIVDFSWQVRVNFAGAGRALLSRRCRVHARLVVVYSDLFSIRRIRQAQTSGRAFGVNTKKT
jgi:hypothetical protein